MFIGHNSSNLPVAIPVKLEATPQGLYIEAYVLKGPAGDNLLAVAKDLQEHGHALGMSIGYKTRDSRYEHTAHGKARRLLDFDLKEVSFASRHAIANPLALVTDVKARKAMTAGTDAAGGALVPDDQPVKGRTAMQYRVEQDGAQWTVYADTDADGDADDNMPVGTYPSAEMAGAVVAALRAQAGMADDPDDDAPDARDDDGKTTTPAPAVKATRSTVVNELPDSAFLCIEAGGVQDEAGLTTPRAKRRLPYKDTEGKVDTTALRTAIARIPALDGMGADQKAHLQARARRLLAAATEGKTADEPDEWKTGSPVSIAALGYTLLELAEQVATELKAMSLLGEETKGYQRIRGTARTALRQAAADILKLADHAERIDRGEDGAARMAWLKQQFALTEV
jgi:hypothetical protein